MNANMNSENLLCKDEVYQVARELNQSGAAERRDRRRLGKE